MTAPETVPAPPASAPAAGARPATGMPPAANVAPAADVAPAGHIPPAGVLEELDGTPIGTPAGGGAGLAGPSGRFDDGAGTSTVPWHRAATVALGLAAARPPLWLYALVAFLARGGLLVLALPIVVLPTFIGIANVVGPASVSADGPGARLVALIAAGSVAVAALILVGTIVAAAAETALHRATVAPETGQPRRAGTADPGAGTADPGAGTGGGDSAASFMVCEPGPGAGGAVARVVEIRLALLVPVAIVTAAAIPAWIGVAYRELTLPSDVAAPLLLRVLAGAPAAGLAVLVAWLAAEVVGGFATRRAVLLGASTPRALGGALVDPLRAPVGTALTVLVALALSALALVPATWAVGAAWDAARRAGAGEVDPVGLMAAALVLAATWIASLTLAGIGAAARATLVTAELLRRAPTRASPAGSEQPSGPAPARHAAAGPPVG